MKSTLKTVTLYFISFDKESIFNKIKIYLLGKNKKTYRLINYLIKDNSKKWNRKKN